MNETAGYRALWSAVLFQAIRDLDGEMYRRGESTTKGPAFYWIYSPLNGVGSMRWICDMLDFDFHKLQTLCMTRAGRAKILKREKVHARRKQEQPETAE